MWNDLRKIEIPPCVYWSFSIHFPNLKLCLKWPLLVFHPLCLSLIVFVYVSSSCVRQINTPGDGVTFDLGCDWFVLRRKSILWWREWWNKAVAPEQWNKLRLNYEMITFSESRDTVVSPSTINTNTLLWHREKPSFFSPWGILQYQHEKKTGLRPSCTYIHTSGHV